MQDYKVEIDVYHGPLDLLLYLIKRDEIDIHDIPIAHITEQYIAYIKGLEKLDINLAGEFLVMASTLLEIKSLMMSPPEPGEALGEDMTGDETEGADPRYELVQQLLAYKRFKDAATALNRRREDFENRFPLRAPRFRADPVERAEPVELDMEDVSVWNLVEAFNTLMEQVGTTSLNHEVVDDDTPLELHQEDIVDRLQRDGAMTLQKMFVGRTGTQQMIGLFLAMLELLRQQMVRVRQETQEGDLFIELRPEVDWVQNRSEDADSKEREVPDPANVNEFDWPDEDARQRYTRRMERRAKGERIKDDEELEEDLASIELEEAAPPPQLENEKVDREAQASADAVESDGAEGGQVDKVDAVEEKVAGEENPATVKTDEIQTSLEGEKASETESFEEK
ncbi:MAG: segregation and condensation protein A [Planctomycetota bacterium]